MSIDKDEAQRIRSNLLNAPLAPGGYSHFINAGTDWVLDILEKEYLKQRLPAGAACFKYLQGPYGSGNPEPLIALPSHELVYADEVGQAHLRLRLASQGLPKGGTVGFELMESTSPASTIWTNSL